MNPAENMEQRIRELRYQTGPATDERILRDALAALGQTQTPQTNSTRTSVWRIIVRNKWTRVAAAAAVAIAVGALAVTALQQSARPASTPKPPISPA